MGEGQSSTISTGKIGYLSTKKKKAKMNLNHSFTPYIKVNWKSHTDLKVRVLTLEDLEENIIGNICDLGLDNISENTKKALNIKEKLISRLHQNFKILLSSTDWCGSASWVSSHKLKYC